MARLDKTIQNYQEKLTDKGIDNIPEFVQSILDADITKGKYSRFLLNCYIQDKFREEDLKGGLDSTVGYAVSLFHKHKGKLSEDMRSVYQYDSPGDLWSAVKQFDGELSGKEINNEDKKIIYSQTEFIVEMDNFSILTPLTVEAAQWWSQGTRWCTGSKENNMFCDYAIDGPLFIILMPDGKKLQCHKTMNEKSIDCSSSFMDEADNDVDIQYIEENWDLLKPIVSYLVNPLYMPEKYASEEFVRNMVKGNFNSASEIFQYPFYRKNFLHILVEYEPEIFHWLSSKEKTYNILKTIIENDRGIFHQLPESYKANLKEVYEKSTMKEEKEYVFQCITDEEYEEILLEDKVTDTVKNKYYLPIFEEIKKDYKIKKMDYKP